MPPKKAGGQAKPGSAKPIKEKKPIRNEKNVNNSVKNDTVKGKTKNPAENASENLEGNNEVKNDTVKGKAKNEVKNEIENPEGNNVVKKDTVKGKAKTNAVKNAIENSAENIALKNDTVKGKAKKNAVKNAIENAEGNNEVKNDTVKGKAKKNAVKNAIENPEGNNEVKNDTVKGKAKKNAVKNAIENPEGNIEVKNDSVKGKAKNAIENPKGNNNVKAGTVKEKAKNALKNASETLEGNNAVKNDSVKGKAKNAVKNASETLEGNNAVRNDSVKGKAKNALKNASETLEGNNAVKNDSVKGKAKNAVKKASETLEGSNAVKNDAAKGKAKKAVKNASENVKDAETKKTNPMNVVKNILGKKKAKHLVKDNQDGSFVGNRLRNKTGKTDAGNVKPLGGASTSSWAMEKRPKQQPKTTSLLDLASAVENAISDGAKKKPGKKEKELQPNGNLNETKIPVQITKAKIASSTKGNETGDSELPSRQEPKQNKKEKVPKGKSVVQPSEQVDVNSIANKENEALEESDVIAPNDVKQRGRKRANAADSAIEVNAKEENNTKKNVNESHEKEGECNSTFNVADNQLEAPPLRRANKVTDLNSSASYEHHDLVASNLAQQRSRRNAGAAASASEAKKPEANQKKTNGKQKKTYPLEDEAVGGNAKQIAANMIAKPAVVGLSYAETKDGNDITGNFISDIAELLNASLDAADVTLDLPLSDDSTDNFCSTPNTTFMNEIETNGQLFMGPRGEYVINSNEYRLSIVTGGVPRKPHVTPRPKTGRLESLFD